MPPIRRIPLADADATARLGRAMAAIVNVGDVICLSGDLGAGKTHLARKIIQSLQERHGTPVEDVPSPTYTLVQSYGAGPIEIVHADLYRLSDPAELDELGLTDAMETALCLVEWPDRMGRRVPPDALRIELSVSGEGRVATFEGHGWDVRIEGIADV
ncbi:tRNA (adenosine(37)-N6)-threonylcarbamoyltransferase complex ATPase subunit type 1 TsaE [Palleronia sp. LCG004]|uniref:tRNA (adenosine(37)-N6)-threonylcarbamoyltransferase complex ATPase subunit type 1 TsaE n=1 Tax=Palleronia sp. LCG004 TaxID=3079304 RepID=UPI002941BED8|nr:tRNA (adenosine(37)-N6)-threonylcarbamoyltransferase complex ATPase subunit type 1 TsaE [Palleronia sp. LCG004]WOI55922.1 tRNA (adenosine(37)-N6)-threonylcarbamoyltransferase complex ATPase subunit type 1 TsaE [Palleronia sp. LCG004]